MPSFNPFEDEMLIYISKFQTEFTKCGGQPEHRKMVLTEFLDEVGINFVLKVKRY